MAKFLVNSKETLAAGIKRLRDNFEEHKHTEYSERNGKEAPLSMNSLLHVWLTEFAADLAKCHRKEVTVQMIESIKRSMKRTCYLDTHWPFLIMKLKCPITGQESVQYSTSMSWAREDKYAFLSWLQAFAAERGTILESKGEYEKLSKSQNV